MCNMSTQRTVGMFKLGQADNPESSGCMNKEESLITLHYAILRLTYDSDIFTI
jgi:hypothetical protein